MTKLTDGRQTISISMCVYENGSMSPDWERDFFDVGSLPYDDEADVYTVDDVEYLVEQANDWQQGVGDYEDELEGQPGHNPDDRIVDIERF